MKTLSLASLFIITTLTVVSCDNKPSTPNNSVSAASNADAQSSLSAAQQQDAVDAVGSRKIDVAQPSSRQWWHDSVAYQIWPRSFYDTDGDGNGDIKGMTEKLPYLKQLGVGAVWVTPIFKSTFYHGYDTVDYYQIDPHYGTAADFDEFIKQSKAAGIHVILDLVINHVSDQHPWFIKSVNREPGFEDYFVWSKTLPQNYSVPWSTTPAPEAVWHYNETRKEWFYSVFGVTEPDLNLQNPAVLNEIKKVAAFWLAKGVDGFRLDAVRYLIEEGGIPHQADTNSTMVFLEAFNKYIKSQKADALLIGEVFADTPIVASYYDKGKGIDAAFDFSFSVNVISSQSAKNTTETAEQKTQYLGAVRDAFWRNLNDHASSAAPNYYYAPFISNHDLDRLTLKANNNPIALKIAAELLLTSPGSPYLYYGEEIAMPQAAEGDDTYRRGIMQWNSSPAAGFNSTGKVWLDDAAWFPWKKGFTPWWTPFWKGLQHAESYTVAWQENDKNSLLSLYKQLIALRNSDIVLRSPDKIRLYEATGNAWVVKYYRGNEARWILINLDADAETSFAAPNALKGNFKNLITNSALTVGDQLSLGAGQVMILQ